MSYSPTPRVSALQRLIFVAFATLLSFYSLPPSQAQTPLNFNFLPEEAPTSATDASH
jgi:hypothetical protein